MPIETYLDGRKFDGETIRARLRSRLGGIALKAWVEASISVQAKQSPPLPLIPCHRQSSPHQQRVNASMAASRVASKPYVWSRSSWKAESINHIQGLP